MPSNTYNFAKIELDILSKSATDPDNRPVVEYFIPEILSLTEKFGNSGQSGGSAPFTANALSTVIRKLCLQQPISPITGIDEEWGDTGIDDLKYQNKRCYALFKNSEGCYYLDAIVWKTQTGNTWTGKAKLQNGEEISSRQYIKGFPFETKTFVIDVIETEVSKGDWEFTVKDESQLNEVFEYYSKQ